MSTISPSVAPNALKGEEALIAEVVRRLLAAGSPQKIVLFGSRARGDSHAHSDLDLLVVEHGSGPSPLNRATTYRMSLLRLGAEMDIDILVYTPAEIAHWAYVPQAFITTILREGKVLYERSG